MRSISMGSEFGDHMIQQRIFNGIFVGSSWEACSHFCCYGRVSLWRVPYWENPATGAVPDPFHNAAKGQKIGGFERAPRLAWRKSSLSVSPCGREPSAV